MPAPVKQIDVARRAGVSRATVSRVLNNYTHNFSVSPKVRKRILDAARELGFRPDMAARTLRSKSRAGIVGWFGHIYPVTFSTGVLDALSGALSGAGRRRLLRTAATRCSCCSARAAGWGSACPRM